MKIVDVEAVWLSAPLEASVQHTSDFGRIKSFDKYSVVLETNNQEQLIFKHAISTVVTQKSPHSYSSGPATASQNTSAASAPSPAVHADVSEA